MKIYTVGYAHWTATALAAKVKELDAILVDIRYSIYSQRGEFRGDSLSGRLVTRYFHMKAWGNVNYNRSSIKIADFRAGLRTLEYLKQRTQTVILMCACADHDTCHRAVIANMLRLHGYETEELEPGDSAVDMRAISLWQPWASLVAWGEKHYETRDWSTTWTGQLAIHATKAFPGDARDVCMDEPFRSVLVAHGVRTLADLPRGAILAVAEGVTCHRIFTPVWREIDPLSDQERAFGDFSVGRVAWELTNVRALPEPVPCRGAMGLWTPDGETVAAVKAALGSLEVSHV